MLVDPEGNDFRLSDLHQAIGNATSPGLDLGTDLLNLQGGGPDTTINAGCYIRADQSDQIGVRTE
jgi:hypothetical protein